MIKQALENFLAWNILPIFNYWSCLDVYCEILCPGHSYSKPCKWLEEWIISYSTVPSLSASLIRSSITDRWYVQCAVCTVSACETNLGQQKTCMRFRIRSWSVVMESSAVASHALPPSLWFEQHPILRFHHTAPLLSICMSTSTAIYSCTPQAISTGLSLHLFTSLKLLFLWNV